MNKLKTLWHAAQFPLLGLLMLFSLYLFWFFLDLPPKDELIEILKGYIEQYGLLIVLAGSFLEALLLIGWYFPGSFIIFLSVILAPSPIQAVASVVIVTLGLYAGYTVNFFLGKYGWYRLLMFLGMRQQLEEAKEKLTRYGLRAIFMSYWIPGLASFTSTAAGILQFKTKKFLVYSLVAVCVWNTFWGTIAYLLGEKSLDTFFTWPFIFLIIFVWVVARYIGKNLSNRKEKNQKIK